MPASPIERAQDRASEGGKPVRKRWRVAVPKPGRLVAQYGRPSPGDALQVCYAWGGGGAEKSDGRILSNALEGVPIFQDRTLCEELEARGYDITTLRFSIERFPTPPHPAGDQGATADHDLTTESRA